MVRRVCFFTSFVDCGGYKGRGVASSIIILDELVVVVVEEG